MKRGRALCAAGMLALAWTTVVHADSPVTATRISAAYLDVPQVASIDSYRAIDDGFADYLLDESTPLDHVAAAINGLQFAPDGKGRNFIRLLVRLRRTDPARFAAFQRGEGSAHLLLAVGYLWAIDEYFDTRRAEALLRAARARAPDSFTVAFMHAIVEAQSRMGGDWCQVYVGPQRLVDNWGPRPLDMRRAALESAMRYMQAYAKDCR